MKSYKSISSFSSLDREINIKTPRIHVSRYRILIYNTYMEEKLQNKK